LLREWFSDGRYEGLGVILGPVSGGLACRDFDATDAYDAWAKQHPDLASKLPTVRTGRGYHVYFRAKVTKTTDLGGGELRGAGSMCVLPPSPHPDGGTYRWIIPLPEGELAEIDPVPAGLAREGLLQKQAEGNGSEPRRLSDGEGEGGGRERAASLANAAPEIQRAIAATLPDRPGIRNRQVFQLVRALKAIPALADLPARELRPVVKTWHAEARRVCRTVDFDETWADFVQAWDKVRVPLSADFMQQILDKAKLDPVAEADYESSDVRLLLSLCRALQGAMGERPFFLAARTGAKLLGVLPMTICRWLKMFVADGWLEVIEKGSERTHRATRFRFRETVGGENPPGKDE